jgi:hypothetical protein
MMRRTIADVMAENVKLQKRVERLEAEIGEMKNKLEHLRIYDRVQHDRPFTAGDYVHYCSNPLLKSHDKVGKIARVTKKCVWVKVDGGEDIRRSKKNVKHCTISSTQ